MPNYDLPRKSTNFNHLLAVTGAVLVILAFINLVGTNILATQGSMVSDIETKIHLLDRESRQISIKIEELTSLNYLKTIADTKGFVSSKNIVFVPSDPTFAHR